MIFRVEERHQLSRYRVNSTELRFQVEGESHFPVAVASIISKYMRELAMELFNQFWSRHCPEVKPTRGYPSDAKRFREAIEQSRARLGIPEHSLWRNR
jgi:ribonuclease HII